MQPSELKNMNLADEEWTAKIEFMQRAMKEKDKKIEKYKKVMYHMKIGYMKELNSLREMLKAKQNLGTTYLSNSLGNKYEYLEVRYFSTTDGLDDDILCKSKIS